MNWINENKDWLFSGAGVVVITGFFVTLGKLMSRRKDPPHPGTSPQPQPAPTTTIMAALPPTVIETVIRAPLLQMSVEQILEDIESRPPYQRDEATQHYIGTRIKFSGILYYLTKMDKNTVHIVIKPKDSSYPMISASISVVDYPEFKVLRDNTPLTVEGRVSAIEYQRVKIEDVTVISG